MNIVIIEDETPALNRIKKLVGEVAPDAQIIGTADSIESAVKLFKSTDSIDLALCDIELADGQSFEIFKQVHITCPIIFTTAYDEFALRAFKLNSIDYLLKPINKTELEQAIQKFHSTRTTSNSYQTKLEQLVENLKPQTTQNKNRFLIKSGVKLISIPIEDIAYFNAFEKLVYVYNTKGQKYIIDQSLDELIKVLNPKMFFQLNRQFIAHIQSIQQIHTYFNGKLKVELIPPVNDEVIVSRERAPEFKAWLDQ